ncbi:MAG: M48 family metallopeptidase [Bacteroidota bacterium]
MQTPYPASPLVTDTQFLNPSSSFRANALKVLASIIFFLLVYVAMVALALLFGMACWYVGLTVLSARLSLITILFGVGIWVLALMIIFFLVKFLFASKKTDRSGMIEITAASEPAVFEFIKNITKETGAPFPKRIYLSPDVNASVSYDSSFWSMFFPVRKNLTIGLGLVNATNLSEFKAIMGHEFGHFSQRSMKLGSYIYNVNQVIYNMLYENESYGNLIEKWGSLHGIFGILAYVTVAFVRLIQKLLQVVYSIINKAYSGLSLQMEYHADAVAASVAGSNHLVSSLYRLEAADMCYNTLISYYNSWLPEQYKAENVYRDHQYVMKHFSAEFKAPFQNGLLQVNEHTLASFNRSNIIVKNQWASHPSTSEREQELNRLGLVTEPDHQSPWKLFTNAGQVQQQMTELLFSTVTYDKTPELLLEDAFIKKYTEGSNKYKVHELYKGYYDDRTIEFDQADTAHTNATLDELLNETNIALPKKAATNTSDLATIEQIRNASVKSFDFKGEKYTKSRVDEVKTLIEAESEVLEKQMAGLDKRLYQLAFQQGSPDEREELKTLFAAYFQALERTKTETAVIESIRTVIMEAYQEQKTPEQSILWNRILKDKEGPFIQLINDALNRPDITAMIKPAQQTCMDEYLAHNQQYFIVDAYMTEALNKLNDAMISYAELAGDEFFLLKKKALNHQAMLLLKAN